MALKVKICGLTNLADARQAWELGADFLGFNFYEPSPRYITPAAAGSIIAALPAEVVTVGIFVNSTAEQMAQVTAQCRLDLVQLHGAEDAADCRAAKALGLGVIKAWRVRGPEDVERVRGYDVEAVLLDAFRPGLYGGTGHRFDWSWVKRCGHEKVFLAGGITPENAAQAAEVGTYAIDLCSGVEARPGVKDREKMKLLFERIAAYHG